MNDIIYKETVMEMPLGYAYHKMIFDEKHNPVDYVFLEVNSSFEELTGLRKKDIKGKRVTEILPEIRKYFDWINYYGEIVKNLEKSNFVQYSEPLKKWYKVFAYADKDDCFVTIFSDITSEKNQEEKYSSLINKMEDLFALHEVVFDENGNPANLRFMEINDAFERFSERKRKDVIGRIITDAFPGYEKFRLERLAKVAVTGKPTEFVQFSERFGKYIHITAYSPKKFQVAVIIRDIDETEKAKRKIIYQKKLNDLYIDTMNTFIVVLDMEGNIKKINRYGLELLGYEKDQLIGKNWFSEVIIPNESLEKVHRVFDDIIKDFPEDLRHYENDIKTHSGELKTISWSNSLLVGEDNKIIGTISSGVDITERKLIEKKLQERENLYRNLYDYSGAGVGIFTKEGHIISFNRKALDNMGIEDEGQIVGKTFCDIFPEKEAQIYSERIQNCLEDEEVNEYEDNVCLPSGEKWFVSKYSKISDEEGNIIAVQIISLDISERKNMEIRLNKEKNFINTMLLSVGDAVIATDNEGRITLMNDVAEKLTEWNSKDAMGRYVEEVFEIISEETGMKAPDIVKEVLETGEKHILGNHTMLITKNGKSIFIEDSAAPIIEKAGEVLGVIIVFRDYTEKRNRIKKIEYLSFHDYLTGLYNRRFFSEELKRLDTERNYPLSLLMGDVNGLKLVNDSFGHEKGDELLVKVADAIKKSCRSDDIVARYGGDEFVVLLPGTSIKGAERTLRRIKQELAEENSGNLKISVSFGYDVKESNDKSIGELLGNAENLMYRCKLPESLSMRNQTINLIINSLYEKSLREMKHSKRVGELAGKLTHAAGMGRGFAQTIELAGTMHDIGKIGVTEEILNKNGKLTEEELEKMKKHSEIGYRILSSVNTFSEIADYILQHHERWDGKGYPQRLKGDEIFPAARIIAVADAYDAMTTERTYRKALNKEEAVQEIKRNAGKQFDPEIARIFVEKVLKMEW